MIVPETYHCKVGENLKSACINDLTFNEADYFDNLINEAQSLVSFDTPAVKEEVVIIKDIFCLVSRPTEKTIFQKYMLSVSLASLIISFMEMVAMIRKDIEYDEVSEMDDVEIELRSQV